MTLHFDPATHTYTVDGARLPSVTEIIRPIAPDFSAIPPAVLERKRALGTAVHEACDLDDQDDLGEVDDQLQGYVDAWRRFKAETGLQVTMSEQRLHHDALRYAGTLDRLVAIGDVMWLLDLKTSADPAPSYGVQLAGYAELLAAAGTVADRRATLHLRADGTYRLCEFTNPNDLAAFRACLSLHHWKESAK